MWGALLPNADSQGFAFRTFGCKRHDQLGSSLRTMKELQSGLTILRSVGSLDSNKCASFSLFST